MRREEHSRPALFWQPAASCWQPQRSLSIDPPARPCRSAMGIGLLTFLLVALATMIVRGNYLQYPVAQAGTLILVIEFSRRHPIDCRLFWSMLFVRPEIRCETAPAAKDEGAATTFIIEEENATK